MDRDSPGYAYVAGVVRAVSELTGLQSGWRGDVVVVGPYDHAEEAAGEINLVESDADPSVRAAQRGQTTLATVQLPGEVDGLPEWKREDLARELTEITFKVAQRAVVLADGPATGQDATMQLAVADMWVEHNKEQLMAKVWPGGQLPDWRTHDRMRWDYRAAQALPVVYNVAECSLGHLSVTDEVRTQAKADVANRLLQAGPEGRYAEITRIIVDAHDGGDRVPAERVTALAQKFRTDLGPTFNRDFPTSPTQVLGSLDDEAREAAGIARATTPESARAPGVPMHMLGGQVAPGGRRPDGHVADSAPPAWKPPTSPRVIREQ